MSQPARFCIRCGAAVPVADSRFCFSCGAEIVSPGLIAEQSPLPAPEPHEEPPAAPSPRPDQQRSTGFTNDKPSPEWWTPGLRRNVRIAAELFGIWWIVNILVDILFGYPVNPIAGFVVAGGYFWWRCWLRNPRQTPSSEPPPAARYASDRESPSAPRPTPDREAHAVRHLTPEHRIPPGLVLERNRQAVVALVCGIVAMLLAIFPGLFYIAWFPGGLALLLGLKARKKPNRRKLASSGLGLGIVSLIFAISYASVLIPIMFWGYDPRR